MKLQASPNAIAILDVAIFAIINRDASCKATEFSTDDQQILAVLRKRDFEIAAYKSGKSDSGIEHQFILRQRSSKMLLSADIVAVHGECLTYTFARIAQDQ